jgi:hypothetical protein
MRESWREERVLERGLFEYFGSLALAAASNYYRDLKPNLKINWADSEGEAIDNQNVD